MKYLIILLFLVSCGADITPKIYKEAEKVCKDLGGIHYIDSRITPTAICKIRENNTKHKKIIIGE